MQIGDPRPEEGDAQSAFRVLIAMRREQSSYRESARHLINESIPASANPTAVVVAPQLLTAVGRSLTSAAMMDRSPRRRNPPRSVTALCLTGAKHDVLRMTAAAVKDEGMDEHHGARNSTELCRRRWTMMRRSHSTLGAWTEAASRANNSKAGCSGSKTNGGSR